MNINSLKGYVMILLSAVGFGSYGVWSKFIGQDFGVFAQGWVRSAIVLIILIPIAYLTNNFKKLGKNDYKWILLPVLFGILTQAPLYYAFNNMDIGTATLIFYATFVVTSYVVGKLLFKENIGVVKITSLSLSIIGLIIMFGLSLAKFAFFAMLMAAVNGIASGGEVATTKKPTEKYSSLQVGIYVWLGIFLSHLPASLLIGERQVALEFNTLWLLMFAFSIVGLVAFWLVVEGYKYVDASIGGLIGLLEIIFGVIFGILIFGEKLTPTVILGGGIIILAAMLPDLVNIINKRKNKR